MFSGEMHATKSQEILTLYIEADLKSCLYNRKSQYIFLKKYRLKICIPLNRPINNYGKT